MSDATRRELESFERMEAFKVENNAVIKDFSEPVGMFTELTELRAQFESKGAAQAGSAASRIWPRSSRNSGPLAPVRCCWMAATRGKAPQHRCGRAART